MLHAGMVFAMIGLEASQRGESRVTSHASFLRMFSLWGQMASGLTQNTTLMLMGQVVKKTLSPR